MTILGREAQLPANDGEWIRLGAILLVIALAMRAASGWPGAIIALTTACAGFLYDHNLYLPFAIAVGAAAAYVSGRRASDPHPVRRAAIEFGAIVTGFGLYEWGRSLVESGEADAVRHAEQVVAFERRIGLLFEGHLQDIVLPYPRVTEWFNTFYSFGFLATVLAVLFYLYATDEKVFGVYRAALGISALLALLTIWLYPLAPPRLYPESGMVDTHMLAGRHRGFINEFAAMPSLHVGWMTLSGYVLYLTTRSRLRWFWLIAPGLAMLTTVMVTGNHYWVDGAVGALYAVGSAVLLARRAGLPETSPLVAVRPPWAARLRTLSHKSTAVLLSLGSLFVYLVVRQLVDPGFTDYWGYLTAQIAATVVILVWLNEAFRPQGGLSWFTQVVVVLNAWADALGTAWDFYARHAIYDKITHFLGGVMLTALAADIIFAVQKRRGVEVNTTRVLAIAVAISVGLGAGWELYEFLGDKLFDTGRHAGSADTVYDIISDTTGSVVSAVLLWRWRASDAPERLREPAELARS